MRHSKTGGGHEMNETCENCRYYGFKKSFPEDMATTATAGECRIRAPQIRPDKLDFRLWPEVWSFHFCGEWKAKDARGKELLSIRTDR
jgi:hypothetical protein